MGILGSQPIESLPGIGPKSASRLQERGIESLNDLVRFLPLDYEDRRHVVSIADLHDGMDALVEGEVLRIQRGRRVFEVEIGDDAGDDSARLRLVWFNAPRGMGARFQAGQTVRAFGKASSYRERLTIAHPQLLARDESTIWPRYPRIAGLSPRVLQRAIATALQRIEPELADLLTPAHLAASELPRLRDAMALLHQPARDIDDAQLQALREGRSAAHDRLALEELVQWEVSVQQRRRSEVGREAFALPAPSAVDEVAAALPFRLTGAQQRVATEISTDLNRESPMRRLLQGDVGSGKTALALIAATQTARAGAQTALVAPTQLLAEQHHQNLLPLSQQLGLRVELLTASLTSAERRRLRDRLATGQIDLLIGTHAIFNERISFRRLALLIVDEQHRFGVAQRLRLADGKTERIPHLLVMTATPIPRSLALVLYAGLDVSTLDELPPGRLPVRTRMVSQTERQRVHRHIDRALAAGGQVYVVCPAIHADSELPSVEELHEELCSAFGASRVGLAHGQLPLLARQTAMAEFAAQRTRILVATTVIEVGVDVPTANLMVVQRAECFGLAQLHQLRGRVGRGGQSSGCLLVHADLSEDAHARLQALCETTDGFRIAERDLDLRGPGHVFGLQQSGYGAFRFADLRQHRALLPIAAAAATTHLQTSATVDAMSWATGEREQAIREDAG